MRKDDEGVVVHYDQGDKVNIYEVVNDLLKRVRELERRDLGSLYGWTPVGFKEWTFGSEESRKEFIKKTKEEVESLMIRLMNKP